MKLLPDPAASARVLERELRKLASPCVKIICAPVADHTSQLFPSEQAAITKAVSSRRDDFSTGRLLARQALQQLDMGAVAIPPDDQRRPCWPDGVVGSISHSSGVCVVALARTGECAAIGVDIERTTQVPQNILPSIAPPEEIERLSGTMPHSNLISVLFSAREAVYKAYNPVTDAFLAHKDVSMDLEEDRFRATLINREAPKFLGRDHISGRYICTEGMVASIVTCIAS